MGDEAGELRDLQRRPAVRAVERPAHLVAVPDQAEADRREDVVAERRGGDDRLAVAERPRGQRAGGGAVGALGHPRLRDEPVELHAGHPGRFWRRRVSAWVRLGDVRHGMLRRAGVSAPALDGASDERGVVSGQAGPAAFVGCDTRGRVSMTRDGRRDPPPPERGCKCQSEGLMPPRRTFAESVVDRLGLMPPRRTFAGVGRRQADGLMPPRRTFAASVVGRLGLMPPRRTFAASVVGRLGLMPPRRTFAASVVGRLGLMPPRRTLAASVVGRAGAHAAEADLCRVGGGQARAHAAEADLGCVGGGQGRGSCRRGGPLPRRWWAGSGSCRRGGPSPRRWWAGWGSSRRGGPWLRRRWAGSGSCRRGGHASGVDHKRRLR